MYKKILVAVDGTATSVRGLDEAIRVAKATGGTLMLVHVVDDLLIGADYVPAVYYEPLVVSLRDSGAKVLAQAMAIVRHAEVPCEQKLLETLGGRAADAIVNAAKEWSAELIVVGTHGRRGFKRLAMGSDAEMVLRLSPVPVLVVRDKAEAP